MAIRGTFDVSITPGESLLPGTGRFNFEKEWRGDIAGVSRGVMVSGGDPAAGTAGYVAMEVFEGTIDGVGGTIAFQQLGSMDHGSNAVRYLVVPGSGTGSLESTTGVLHLSIDQDTGVHSVVMEISSDG